LDKGRIIKLIGGLYTVIGSDGRKHVVKPLGIFRYQNERPKVGDLVKYDDTSITELEPRENDLVRPAICNVDQVLLVMSVKRPDFDSQLMDRFLVLIQQSRIDPVILLTKADLADQKEREELERILTYYKKFFPVIFVSTKTGEGLKEVSKVTGGKVNVLAGQTGAGKSSLLNALNPELELKTDDISEALGRGKHTTRHVELIEFADGWIADTPGFSRLEFLDLKCEDLPGLYPDFALLAPECRFGSDCRHLREPGCMVKEKLAKGLIPQARYDNYVRFYNEIKAIKPKYRKDDEA